MGMPKRCGKCRLVMKTTEGNCFCLITRQKVGVDYKHPDCPLEDYKSRSSERPNLLPCSCCKGKIRELHSNLVSGKTQYWYSCKRCGFGGTEPQYGDTKVAARKAWNNLVR